MRLYLIRHGEAGQAPRDSLRELTREGRARTQHNAAAVLPRLVTPATTIIASPLARARQTAAIIHGVWNPEAALVVDDCLVPDSSPEAVARFVDALPDQAWPLVLVGHQPLFGSLLAWLCDRPELANTVTTSSISALDLITFGQGCATLDWQVA